MKMRKKICPNYCGIACVDGSCPKANIEEYRERCMDVIKKCSECPYYHGCIDCCFFATEYCIENYKGSV